MDIRVLVAAAIIYDFDSYLFLVLQKRFEEVVDAVPGNLDTDAKQDESDDAKDSMGSGWRDGAGDLRGVGVTEVDTGAEHNGGDKQAGVGEYGVGDGVLMSVDAEGEHDDDATGPGSDGEGK